ncbi:MAG: hypothetical protein ACI9MB_004354 [Verrucomicrobiales bacterium]|jgi:hypothetical protein
MARAFSTCNTNHSQPTGHKASNRDLTLLIAPTNPDRIELGKGLQR